MLESKIPTVPIFALCVLAALQMLFLSLYIDQEYDMKSRTNTILLVLILIFAMLAALFTGLGYFRGQDGQDETSYKEQTDKEIADKIDSCYRQVREKTDFKPDIAIVLGSGLGDFADNIDVEGTIPYSEIKGFPVSTAPGHAGEFVYGTLGDKKVICMPESVLEVSDDGIGISEEYLPHIFEPFSQEKRKGYESVGTGLGLSIVSQLVELMHGTIDVKSEKDKGTIFVIRLHFDRAEAGAGAEHAKVQCIRY